MFRLDPKTECGGATGSEPFAITPNRHRLSLDPVVLVGGLNNFLVRFTSRLYNPRRNPDSRRLLIREVRQRRFLRTAPVSRHGAAVGSACARPTGPSGSQLGPKTAQEGMTEGQPQPYFRKDLRKYGRPSRSGT